MLITIISFLFVFTVIAMIHEAGHLFFAKRAGIRVYEFGIGFGPTIWQTEKNKTIYKINLIPILGYVKIAGLDTEDPAEKDTPENEKYTGKPLLARFLAIFSGAFMNIILGFVVFSLIIMISGLPAGTSNQLQTISPGSVAAKIGLQPGDKLLAINNQKFARPEQAVEVIHQSAGKELILTIERENTLINIKATPEYNKKHKMGLIGFSLKPITHPVNPLMAIYYGAKETLGMVLMIFTILGQLITGRLGISDLAGPVGIAQVTGQYAQQGILSLLYFLGFFSVNVAVLNLLPLPALDGGRLVFILIELVRGKPVSIETENKIHSVGMYLLLGLLAIISVNDVLRLFR